MAAPGPYDATQSSSGTSSPSSLLPVITSTGDNANGPQSVATNTNGHASFSTVLTTPSAVSYESASSASTPAAQNGTISANVVTRYSPDWNVHAEGFVATQTSYAERTASNSVSLNGWHEGAEQNGNGSYANSLYTEVRYAHTPTPTRTTTTTTSTSTTTFTSIGAVTFTTSPNPFGTERPRSRRSCLKYKCKWCQHTLRNEDCPYSFRCRFAHCPSERRTVEMNRVDRLSTIENIRQFYRARIAMLEPQALRPFPSLPRLNARIGTLLMDIRDTEQRLNEPHRPMHVNSLVGVVPQLRHRFVNQIHRLISLYTKIEFYATYDTIEKLRKIVADDASRSRRLTENELWDNAMQLYDFLRELDMQYLALSTCRQFLYFPVPLNGAWQTEQTLYSLRNNNHPP